MNDPKNNLPTREELYFAISRFMSRTLLIDQSN